MENKEYGLAAAKRLLEQTIIERATAEHKLRTANDNLEAAYDSYNRYRSDKPDRYRSDKPDRYRSDK